MLTEKKERPDITENPKYLEYKKHLNKFIQENLSKEDQKLYNKLLYQAEATRNIYYSAEVKTKEEASRDYFNYDSNYEQLRIFEEKREIIKFARNYWKSKK